MQEEDAINAWKSAGVNFNPDVGNTHGLGSAADGPLGFVNTVSYKSDADAAHWIAYVDEWAPMAKKIGMLELKAVQTSGSTGYFVGVFPNNEAHYAWDAYMATDENIPKMFATISHMDVKLWGALSHKTREIIARWDSMPQLAVTATEAAIASAGRPDPAQANQQIVNVAFPTAEGLQEMIDAFLSPNIWNMIESSGSTWVFFRTGATTGMIYQSEPSPQAVADTIGNADFGAKLGPIVGKMVRSLFCCFASTSRLSQQLDREFHLRPHPRGARAVGKHQLCDLPRAVGDHQGGAGHDEWVGDGDRRDGRNNARLQHSRDVTNSRLRTSLLCSDKRARDEFWLSF